MSVEYEIKEHLIVTKTTDMTAAAINAEVINLSELAGLKILGMADIYTASFTSEKTKLKYTDSLTLEDIKTLAVSISHAETFELVLNYTYTYHSYVEYSELAGPWELDSLLEGADKEELSGMFYSMWNISDSSDTNGTLCAYGEKDGVFYNGTVEPKEIKEFPKGNWYTSQSVMSFDEFKAGENAERLAELCRAVNKYSSTDDLSIKDDEIDYWVSNLTADSAEVLEDIISKGKEMAEIVGDTCLWNLYFTDADAEDDMRLFTVEFDDDMNPTYLLAEV